MRNAAASPRLNDDEIRARVLGHWPSVLSHLAIHVPSGPKKHGPCPACGGTDRFRFDDKDGRGTWFCNQCRPQAGDGFALVQNVRGCDFPHALQLVGNALGYAHSNGKTRRTIDVTYDYTDADGQLLFQVVRFIPKGFLQRRPDGQGGWTWHLTGIEPVLYKLPEISGAERVLIVEGEKDVETAYRLGLPEGWAATCNAMGAGKWRESYSDALQGKHVVILPDADTPGETHAVQVAQSLVGKAATVRRLTLPEGAQDLSLWAVDRPQADFHDLLRQAALWSDGIGAQYPEGDPDARPHALDLSKALVSYTDLLALEIPERPRYLPWLLERSNVMVYGPRGVGKTFFQLALAVALTTGKPLWEWDCPTPVGVLYVDGEMPLDDLRKRTTALMVTPPIAPLEFLTGQLVYERCGGKDLVLSSAEMRHEVVKILKAHPAIRVLILDNISCLFSGINEDSKQDWEPNSAWLIQLRHRGITTVLVHHAGKGGQQRGTSGREDSLDTVIQLAKPAGYDPREGVHFELKFTKCRSVTGDAVTDLDVKLHTLKEGLPDENLQWVWKPLEVSMLDRARQLLKDGVQGPTALAEELEVTVGYASKILKKLKPEEVA